MIVVTLTTDFGTVDGYVGEMKGVLASRAPSAHLVDVTHEIPRGDVAAGGWVLERIWTRFPEGTVHCAVVDPGVGGARRAVVVRVADRWFVGPDNGLLSRVLLGREPQEALVLDPERVGLRPLSDTFHGRDLFAPGAAHLAAGGDPSEVGPSLGPAGLVRLEEPPPERKGKRLEGRIVHVDRFGNLVTDVPSGWLPETPVARVGGREIRGLSRSFAEREPGEALLTRGSGGTLEISVRDGSAAGSLGVGRGARVEVRPAEGSEGRDPAR